MNLPLIDLHRHLDGNVRLQTILELGRKHNLPLPAWDLEGLRPHVQVTKPQPGVMAFIEKFKWMIAVLKDYDACRRIAYENVEDAKSEGLAYVELRFSPVFMSSSGKLDPAGIVEAVCDGVTDGRRDFKQPVNLIGIISRTYGPEAAWKELKALLTRRDQFVALDLAGDEAHYPAELFSEHFRGAREAGWQVTVHAGEIAGPASIWQAIMGLGATRIGHGVSALADPDLIQMMKEKQIGIECNLTSNVQTSTVPDYPSHPLRQFLEKGLLATINTDDPGISGIDLAYEIQVAAPAAGLNPVQIEQAKANAVEVSFLTEDQKNMISKGTPFF
ncbi:MAG: adenosine deaminase [Chloroflexi bacterium RBG_16_54_18]|nr:MAG: adenosine deaminase [Chloroflexi bacterium RBG_16_54_18]